MTASVLIRDMHKISKRDYSKRNYETKDNEEIGLLLIFDVQERASERESVEKKECPFLTGKLASTREIFSSLFFFF